MLIRSCLFAGSISQLQSQTVHPKSGPHLLEHRNDFYIRLPFLIEAADLEKKPALETYPFLGAVLLKKPPLKIRFLGTVVFTEPSLKETDFQRQFS